MKSLVWLALVWLAGGAGAAVAADQSVSYSTWIVSGNMVTLRLTLPVREARHLVGSSVPVLTTDRLKEYVLQHVAVSSAAGSCPAIDQGYDLGQVDPLAVGPDLYGFELVYRCPTATGITLRDAVLFAERPQHVDFARIRTHGEVHEQLFTFSHQRLRLPDAAPVPEEAVSAFVRIGLLHAIEGAEGWCVVLAAVLLVRRWRDVAGVLIVLAFGYLVSLGLSASGWVLPRLPASEAFVGLLVGGLGAVLALREGPYRMRGLLVWASLLVLLGLTASIVHAPATALALLGGALLFAGVMRSAGAGAERGWLVLVGLFALLDGAVMASVLPPAQLSRHSLLRVLAGLDGGAWIIQSLTLAALAGLLWHFRARFVIAARAVLEDVCAAVLSGIGTFWLVSRLWT